MVGTTPPIHLMKDSWRQIFFNGSNPPYISPNRSIVASKSLAARRHFQTSVGMVGPLFTIFSEILRKRYSIEYKTFDNVAKTKLW